MSCTCETLRRVTPKKVGLYNCTDKKTGRCQTRWSICAAYRCYALQVTEQLIVNNIMTPNIYSIENMIGLENSKSRYRIQVLGIFREGLIFAEFATSLKSSKIDEKMDGTLHIMCIAHDAMHRSYFWGIPPSTEKLLQSFRKENKKIMLGTGVVVSAPLFMSAKRRTRR